jgi:hypothetical protein
MLQLSNSVQSSPLQARSLQNFVGNASNSTDSGEGLIRQFEKAFEERDCPAAKSLIWRLLMRTSSELMPLFIQLIQMEFHAAPVTMWSEAFSAWASVRGRTDDDSIEQQREYATFLKDTVECLARLEVSYSAEVESQRELDAAQLILRGIFAHVARLIMFAEAKVANGKMLSGAEAAVLDRDTLANLFGVSGIAQLADAMQLSELDPRALPTMKPTMKQQA